MRYRLDYHLFSELALQHQEKKFSFREHTHKSEVSSSAMKKLLLLEGQLTHIKGLMQQTSSDHPRYELLVKKVSELEKKIKKKKSWTL